MAKTSYLGANIVAATATFDEWRVRTNQLVYDTGTIIVTVGNVAQPNSTNHALTTGNGHVNGFFSANTLVAVDGIRGGTIDTSGNLLLSSNIIPTSNGGFDLGSSTNTIGNSYFSYVFAINDIESNYSSDKNLKDNLQIIHNAVDIVEKINGYMFEWNTDDHKKGKVDLGVVAQEIQEVLPFLVDQRDDGVLAVKYQSLIPLLVQAVKELSERIKKLEVTNGS